MVPSTSVSNPTATETRGYSPDRPAVLNRLRRIAGQVRGLARMVDEGRYCIDILTQIAAVRSALDGVALSLLEAHVRHCVAQGSSDALETHANEIVTTLAGEGRARSSGKATARERLSRLEQQVDQVQAMVEADRYCIDVLEEINTAKTNLEAVSLNLVAGHVRTCLTGDDAADRDLKARELMAALGRLVKTA